MRVRVHLVETCVSQGSATLEPSLSTALRFVFLSVPALLLGCADDSDSKGGTSSSAQESLLGRLHPPQFASTGTTCVFAMKSPMRRLSGVETITMRSTNITKVTSDRVAHSMRGIADRRQSTM